MINISKYYLNTQRDSSKNIFSYFACDLNFIPLPLVSFNICTCRPRLLIRVTWGWGAIKTH